MAHADERRVAHRHLQALSPGDGVLYDRGYFSAAGLRAHIERGLHPVFRLQAHAHAPVQAFVDGHQTEAAVEVCDGTHRLPLRRLRYTIGDPSYFLGTTRLDRRRYPARHLARLDHQRWSIEELFKTVKHRLTIEPFHGRSERKVRQELFADFVLITLARVCTLEPPEGVVASVPTTRGRCPQANFRQALQAIGQQLEGLLLAQAQLVRETAQQIVQAIRRHGRPARPDRSYARVSRRPIGKWKPPKPAKSATT